MAATITAVQTTDAGAPQAGITVSDLSEVTGSTVVVDVSWDGQVTWNAVRGGTVEGALGSTFVRDHVPALGRESVYRATITGGSEEVITTTVTVESDTAWLQDPLDPRSAVPMKPTLTDSNLMIMEGSLESFTTPQAVDTVTPMFSDLPVASIGQALKFQGVPFALSVPAAQGALINAMRALMANSGQLVLRGLPTSLPIDAVVHVTAVNRTEHVATGGTRDLFNAWSMAISQAAPKSVQIVIPWWTYDQVKALVGTEVGPLASYVEVTAAMPEGKTYVEWQATPGVSA